MQQKGISMSRDYINKCLGYIEENLNEHRKKHTFGVRETAMKLAEIYGADVDKAETAALFHDIAKPLDQESSDVEVKKYKLPEYLLGNRNLAHGPIAACWAKDKFGVKDEDVLDAIRYHTSAKKDMPLLSEIIFVADTVEPGRTYEESRMLREKSYKDLHGVYKYILLWMRNNLRERGINPGNDTMDAIKEVLDD